MLQPFDKVMVRDNDNQNWVIDFFSHYNELIIDEDEQILTPFVCIGGCWAQCIPFCSEFAPLVGTKQKPYLRKE